MELTSMVMEESIEALVESAHEVLLAVECFAEAIDPPDGHRGLENDRMAAVAFALRRLVEPGIRAADVAAWRLRQARAAREEELAERARRGAA